MQVIKNFKFIVSALIVFILLTPNVKSAEECFEGTSRAIFKFNMALDEAILEPIAKGYNKLPSPIKSGTSNFTSNIGTLLSIPNNFLQGNFKQLGHSIGSFAVNTTVGVLGFFNPAEKNWFEAAQRGCWSNFRFIRNWDRMLFCSSSVWAYNCRDSIGLIADSFVDPFAHVTIREHELFGTSGNNLDYFSVKATGTIDFRADNDKNFQSLEKNSIDLYSTLKSIYLQDRENKIRNSIEDEDEWGNLDN